MACASLSTRSASCRLAVRGAPRLSPPPRCVRAMAANFHELTASTLDGRAVSFDQYAGKVVLVTNVACACGLTKSNYQELVALHERYGPQGLSIMCWPCNQFGRQESGSPAEIAAFVKDRFGVAFDMMEKVDVNGPGTHPVWRWLKGACAGCDDDVTWNFGAKFIINKAGDVVERRGDSPLACEPLIKELLAA